MMDSLMGDQGWWTATLMMLGFVLFWVVVVLGVIALVRLFSRKG